MGMTFPEEIDLVVYINLNSRTDRRQEMEAELERVGVPKSKILRWEATRMPKNGALGCSTSHVAVLEHIQTLPDTVQTILVLEDDFNFIEDVSVVHRSLTQFLTYPKDIWDLTLVSYYVTERADHDDLVSRVFKAFHTSGYLLNRSGLPKVLDNFKTGRDALSRSLNPIHHALDVYWWKLMKEGKSFYFNKALGYQRMSYSNISACVVRSNSEVDSKAVNVSYQH